MLCIFLLINIVCVLCSDRDPSPKLIIDNDAGGDDAMAIFLALLYGKHYNGPKLIALTTGNGNTNEDNVCVNNQRILQVIKRQDVPIYRGSKSSLLITPEDSVGYYGKDGLADTGEVLTDLVPAQSQNAVSALIELSKIHNGKLTVVTLGTLTNVALALKIDPEFISRLAHLYVGAGHIHTDAYPKAEFNAHMDVEAYHVVAKHATPDKVTILPFSQVQGCNFSVPWRKEVLGGIQTDIIRAQNQFEQVSLRSQSKHWQALDPAVVAVAVRPGLVGEYKYSKNDIIMCGEKRGIITNEFVDKEHANVRIVNSIKSEEYRQFLLDLFALE